MKKKTQEEIERQYDKAVESEIDGLMEKYQAAACVNDSKNADHKTQIFSMKLLKGVFDDAVGNIDNGFFRCFEAEIAKSVFDKNNERLMTLMTRLFDASILREAQHNVYENREPDDGL